MRESGLNFRDCPEAKRRQFPAEIRDWRIAVCARDEQRDDRRALRPHFYFADGLRLYDNAFGGGDRAQTGNDKFSAQNYDDRPGGREMFFNKNNQSGGDEQFVGNGVKQFAEIGNLVTASCDVSVKNVCERRGKKNTDSERVTTDAEPFFRKRRQKHDHEKRDDDNSCNS